jgi:hypothetical protein
VKFRIISCGNSVKKAAKVAKQGYLRGLNLITMQVTAVMLSGGVTEVDIIQYT